MKAQLHQNRQPHSGQPQSQPHSDNPGVVTSPAPPDPAEEETIPVGIFDIESAPKTGEKIFLAEKVGDSYVWHRCMWHETRLFENHRWVIGGWWVLCFPLRQKISFDPVRWTDKIDSIPEYNVEFGGRR